MHESHEEEKELIKKRKMHIVNIKSQVVAHIYNIYVGDSCDI